VTWTDPDVDGDGIADPADNCPTVYNDGQQNFDADGPPWGNGDGIGDGKGITGEDETVPNGDGWGDACDSDDDNDGAVDGSDYDPRGDVTYDDDNDGNPHMGCLGGSDGADDGPSWDINCDGIRDGVTTTASTADTDGDGLWDNWETRRWGTCPHAFYVIGLVNCSTVSNTRDTDGDGRDDCTEVFDNNGDGVILFPTDTVAAARAALLTYVEFGKDGVFDIDGSDAILFPTDAYWSAQASQVVGYCSID
jgi:hypothetical protein